MDLLQAMKERHSVRSYDEKSIEAGTVEKLRSFIKECNKESGLHMQLVLDEPHAFEGFMAHNGKFSGDRNYIALIGRKGNDLEEKLCLVIAIGYGQTQGVSHNSKPREKVMNAEAAPQDWFLRGIDAALLAPTAMNQQKFTFTCKGNLVSAKAGLGFYSKTDLGIVKYHFELGAGKENFRWV